MIFFLLGIIDLIAGTILFLNAELINLGIITTIIAFILILKGLISVVTSFG
jgi:uncharacterized membrane protein HdeD (DUF308 family)